MNIKEKTNKGLFGGQNLPKLHGHTKITLTDVNTGEKEVVEKDNLVTDMLANIYANNIFGALDYSKIQPLRDMLGGVLIFEDSQDTTDVFVPNDDTNKLVGNCGMDSHTSASTTRGNFNGALSEMIADDTGYKFVYDFSTNQANGTWKSISLCNKLGGSVGTRPIEAIENGSLLGVCSNKTKTLVSGVDVDYETDYYNLIKVDLENGVGIHAALSGDTLTLTDVEICAKKFGINNTCDRTNPETVDEVVATDTHVITLSRSFDREYSGVCCDGSYVYVVEPNSDGGNTLYIDKVDLSDYSVSGSSISDASLSLAKVRGRTRYFDYAVRTCVSGGFIYWQKYGQRTFYKFDLSNYANIEELSTNLTSDIDEDFGLVEFGEGFIVGANFFINDDEVYPMTKEDITRIYTTSYSGVPIVRVIKDGDIFYAWAYIRDTLYNSSIFAFVAYPRLYLGTIQNLGGGGVTKTNTKTAQIEYSITLAE